LQERIDQLNAWDIDSKLEQAMDALRLIHRLTYFRAEMHDGLLFAGFYLKNLMFCCLMNPPTILMPNR